MNKLVLMELKFTLDLKYNGRALMFSYFVSRRQLHVWKLWMSMGIQMQICDTILRCYVIELRVYSAQQSYNYMYIYIYICIYVYIIYN